LGTGGFKSFGTIGLVADFYLRETVFLLKNAALGQLDCMHA
jgi:hypothetical protein